MSMLEDDLERGLTVEVLYENQRGLWICGTPHFSHRMLNPFDSAPWTDKFQRFSPVDIHSAQLPDPSWDWADPYWYIDSSGDIDEEGWEYAFMFGSNSWHDSSGHLFDEEGGFDIDHKPTFADRQMRYITPNSPDKSEEDTPIKSKGIVAKLRECRIDRERFIIIDEYLKLTNKIELQEKVPVYVDIDISKYLNEFDFYSDYKMVVKGT
ncbi:hypothetical protein K493DRAFT_298801 [Basidiobolus meristosporus CBS 931.73]|uniref:Uncharacterized protein n=1 Tax=Basidiobolus meristosporus CBS 931.73 TaxID=1314790 RepID=A0A1Y1YRI5_9FUNG|nr:hypothetical protein K493DRAFT_298801 [Basidiobolus meristosporus CBS 931.73]|eukprot:ORY00642.1 hypothetical protein K493DRAFT_298801 [Basidiobolus meristosporus CBS 931.73]